VSLPGHLVAAYWATVERLLVDQGLTVEQARTEIHAYLARMNRHGAVETIYHWEPEETAGTLAKAHRAGGFDQLPEPQVPETPHIAKSQTC